MSLRAWTCFAVIMSVTQPLTRQTARELARAVERVDRAAPIVIDLTAIPGFDTDGAEALLALQASQGADRVSIVGLRQATARLVGPEEPAPVATVPVNGGWALRRLRNLVESIAFASSTAALRGQELLVVNVAAEVAESLRVAGLSATTYVAPEPPPVI